MLLKSVAGFKMYNQIELSYSVRGLTKILCCITCRDGKAKKCVAQCNYGH